jgi:hypothetical protein
VAQEKLEGAIVELGQLADGSRHRKLRLTGEAIWSYDLGV